jgi:hypothetical protein
MAIPKRPLAVSKAKKTLPLTIDWGEGIPKDRLRYINAREEGLIKASRSTTAERSHAGVTAYADDSASSKGVERGPSPSRGADGPSGVGRGASGAGGPSRAGQGPNSSPSRSSSSPSSAGGGSKSSSSSTPASSPSKAPNAAAQAASDKYNSRPSTNASAASVSRAAASVSTSKAPNAAAAAASDRLRAMDKATAASKASSVQSMINAQSGTSTPWGGQQKAPTQSAAAAEEMVRRDFVNNQLGNLTKDPAISKSITNALGNAMWNTRVADATRLAQSEPTLGNFGEVVPQQGPAAGFRTLKQQLDIIKKGASKVKDPARSYHTWGLAVDVMPPLGPGETITDPKFGERTYQVNKELQANMDDPAVTWGGNWNFVDPGHFQYGSGPASVSAATYGTPISVAGTRPAGAPAPSLGGSVGLAAAVTPQPTPLQKAMDSWNPPKPTAIPEPNGQTVASTVPQQQQAQTPMPNVRPPSQNMQAPPGWGQTAAPNNPPTMSPNNPFGSLGPVGAVRQQSLAARIGVDDALSANPVTPTPNARPLSQNMQQPTGLAASSALPGFTPQSGFTPQGLPGNFRGTAGQAYNTTSPSTYSPQAGPGDQGAGDAPQISSDNPMQGPSNPMQEGENPQIKRDRQIKYASRGSTIGGIIAGPLGTVVGATLGWQMGKTPPRQRQAIASNPQALRANVQSINTMVEERGGKGNPQMQVTDAGLRDVLTDPSKVQSNPAQYTTLEQMLAALAQGIDPETGKPV